MKRFVRVAGLILLMVSLFASCKKKDEYLVTATNLDEIFDIGFSLRQKPGVCRQGFDDCARDLVAEFFYRGVERCRIVERKHESIAHDVIGNSG